MTKLSYLANVRTKTDKNANFVFFFLSFPSLAKHSTLITMATDMKICGAWSRGISSVY